jgi:S-adenosylmethionine/arginine decarboxylase-like enzyme
MKNYGKEVIIDLHNCNPDKFTKDNIKKYLDELCELIDMEQVKLHWWDSADHEDYAEDHLIGISAVQFIKTSDIVIHTLSVMKRVYLNIFSCKDFDGQVAIDFSKKYFEGDVVSEHVIDRV